MYPKKLHVFLALGFLHTTFAKPITPDSVCISPGLACEASDDTCCTGYKCTPTSSSEAAYCVINPVRKVPFIMPMPGQASNFEFMDRHHLTPSENDQHPGCVVLGGICHPDSPSNMACCLDSTCEQLGGRNYCVETARPSLIRRDRTTCGNPDVCSMDEHCCDGNACQKSYGNGWLGKCEPVDPEPKRTPCYSYLDCPAPFRCSHIDPGSWEGHCTAPEHHEGHYINRRDHEQGYHEQGYHDMEEVVETEQAAPTRKIFPALPQEDCREEGCPCYYSSPCTMGICDNYNEWMIGKCRTFRPGEAVDLQPGFPIDTLYCNVPPCFCNKWFDHCWKGACDHLNRAGYGTCRWFRPTEEPRMHRTLSYECTAVGCVCDGPGWPCVDSRCVIKGGNMYGRCRRFDINGRMLYTRSELPVTGFVEEEYIGTEEGAEMTGGMELPKVQNVDGHMSYNTEYYETHDTWGRYPAQLRDQMRGHVAEHDG
ncbi:hypothetical protein DFH27DRAFT_617325 [Peziza echinospora]|nr:hypothetical protein DFH27DRAFT_617325 [Peziza echinospora]